ncbi:MAG: flavodoxin, partial [Pseudomonadota bacterium]|nr:flavodoxin [Pseudomonadota bacterium]
DRNYFDLEGKVEALPYAIFVSASTDGTGAVNSIRRICSGLNLKEVQEALILTKKISESDEQAIRDFGLTMAVGIDAGIF